jgi:argininosuccinate synthase
VRFELGYYGLKPDVKVIAPWREWDLNSRTKLIAYAEVRGRGGVVGVDALLGAFVLHACIHLH